MGECNPNVLIVWNSILRRGCAWWSPWWKFCICSGEETEFHLHFRGTSVVNPRTHACHHCNHTSVNRRGSGAAAVEPPLAGWRTPPVPWKSDPAVVFAPPLFIAALSKSDTLVMAACDALQSPRMERGKKSARGVLRWQICLPVSVAEHSRCPETRNSLKGESHLG